MVDRPKPPAEIVNLRKARKDRARAAAQVDAAANRAKHGTSKAIRSIEEARKAKASRDLDGHKRQDDGNSSDN